MKEENKFHFYFLVCFLVPFFCIVLGLKWGIPDNTRISYFFPNNLLLYKLLPEISKDVSKALDRDYLIFPRNYYKEIKRKISLREIRSGLLFSEDPDEMRVLGVIAAMNPKKMQFKPKEFSYGYPYYIGVAMSIKIGSLLHYIKLVPDVKYYLANPSEFGKFYIIGRAFNLLFLLLNFIGLYLCAKYLGVDKYSSVLIALAICSTPLLISSALIMKPHYAATALISMSSAFIFKFISKYSAKKDYWLSILFIALAVSYQYLSIIMLPFIFAVLYIKENKRSFLDLIKKYFISILIIFSIFIILNPYIMFNIKDFLHDITIIKAAYKPLMPTDVLGSIISYLWLLIYSGGLGFIFCFLVNLYNLFFAKRKYKLFLNMDKISFICYLFIIYLLIFSIIARFPIRFYVLFFPFVALKLFEKILPKKMIFYFCIFLFVLNGVYASGQHYLASRYNRPYYQASIYISENIPAGTTILVSNGLSPQNHVMLNYEKYYLGVYEEYKKLSVKNPAIFIGFHKNIVPGKILKQFHSPWPLFALDNAVRSIYIYLLNGNN